MKSNATISVVTVRSLIRAAHEIGIQFDFNKIAAKHNLAANLLEGATNRMSLQVLYDVSRELEKELDEPMFGVRATELVDLKMMKGFTDLLFVARTVKDGLEVFDRYYQIYSQLGRFRLDLEGELGKISFFPTDPEFSSYHQVDGSMVLLQKFAKYLGGEGFLALHFQHACPAGCKDKYEEAFGMPVLFEQPESCFYFNKEWLASEVNQFADPCYQRLGSAERRLSKELGATDLAEQVKFILRKMLVTGEVSINQMADALGMSLRTFQRRLKANELNFTELLETTRKDLAIEYLSTKENSVSDISTLVGYSDLSSFLRAFKSWTGVGPGKYREENFA